MVEVRKVIQSFCEVSGHIINLDKSRMLCSKKVNFNKALELSHVLGIGITADLGKYLGVPIIHKRPNAETDDGVTPLLSSVAAGSLTCIELLVQAGANVNINAGGATPLHIAADNGNPEFILKI
ncbi:hypothetical protein K1719_009534 [Acacia pycnantha]|nr:hypothetical protein K1719_009534 [Acacia pycnantha]